MFKKNDPLIDSVKSIMEKSDLDRQAEAAVNEEFGVTSKNALPHELRSKYNQRLAEAKKCMYEGEPPKKADKDYDKDGKVESPKDEVWGSRLKAAKEAGKLEEKELENPGLEAAAKKAKEKKEKEKLDEAKYSAKAGRAGEDLGKPGKNFKKIADKAAKRYGSKEKGEKVAGAILKKIRAKHMEESVEQIDEKAPPGAKYERMVKHIKAGYKEGGLTDTEKRKAYGAAWKAKKKEELQKEAVDLVTEEIRNNLQQKLVAIHENGDEAAFEAFVTSLTEEQIAILGLAEETPTVTAAKPQQNPPTAPVATPAEKPVGQNPTPTITQRVAGVSADIKGTGADPYAYNKSSIPTTGLERGDYNKPSHLSGGGSQVASASSSGTAPSGGGISGDAGRTSVNKGMTNQAGAIYGNTSSGKLALQNKPVSTKNPTAGSGSVAPTNVATKTSAPIKTGSVNKTAGGPVRPGMRSSMAAKRPGMSSFQSQVHTGAIAIPGSLEEEVKPQIKESFEHFLRNKFLKG